MPVRREDRGSASLEFLTAGVLLLVPLVYLVLALGAVQAGAFAVEGAARSAARVAVLAAGDRQDADAADVRAAAERAARTVLTDADLDGAAASVHLTCAPTGSCVQAGARVHVRVAASIVLPFVPDLFGVALGSVRVEGVATQSVSKFTGGGA